MQNIIENKNEIYSPTYPFLYLGMIDAFIYAMKGQNRNCTEVTVYTNSKFNVHDLFLFVHIPQIYAYLHSSGKENLYILLVYNRI